MNAWDELNGLELRNEKGILRVERDADLAVQMTVTNPDIALTMTGLYQMEELVYVLRNQGYARIKHGYFSPSIGQKKVLETIFAQEDACAASDYSLIFRSEDTTYRYPLDAWQWKELMSLYTYIVETN